MVMASDVERHSPPRGRAAPGPRGLDAVRTMWDFRTEPIRVLTELGETYGEISKFSLGIFQTFVLNHPEFINHVLQTNRSRYTRDIYATDLAKRIFGERGLGVSEGEQWKRQRRLLQPFFQPQRVSTYSGLMVDEAGAMLDRWRIAAERGDIVDVLEDVSTMSLRTTVRALFGVEMAAEHEKVICEEFLALSRDLALRVRRLLPLPPVLPTPQDIQWWIARNRLNSSVEKVISVSRRRLNPNSNDFISVLLQARDQETGEGMSDDEIQDQVKNFMFGGHETTSHGISWSLYLLALNPDARERLEREVDEALGGRTPTPADLPKLPYAGAVFEEAMRLFPPVWGFLRCALEDDEIGGYHIPRGAFTVISPYLLHRNPAFWDCPIAFRPERFLAGPSGPPQRSAYLPFGSGPHVCIGKWLALMQGQLTLAMVAQRYRLTLVPGKPVVPEPLMTLLPRGGVPMTLTPRSQEGPRTAPIH